ncbi:MAG TPA: epoxide hydrolase [Candidatus Saccharimonadales bacterium]|nr:epoxide hydrolase [Candidatus Saccharimonadales bacterium]
MTKDNEIKAFKIKIPEKALTDLKSRIKNTRWPNKELVDDRSQGVQLETMKKLAKYWANSYDWRTFEKRMNALPQFMTNIDGVDIHFIHVKSSNKDALPAIITHGWPGSIVELLDVVGPLTEPEKHGGHIEDAFHVVIPSLPGYGFSGQPTDLGWGPARIAKAWAELMSRLGYDHYVAQGGDVGASVTDTMARQAPKGLIGIHTNLLVTALAGIKFPEETKEERAARESINTFNTFGKGYFIEQDTRPQTIGYALSDSPIALAAWMLDHDTDSYYKITQAFVGKKPSGNLTRDNILDNITLYWLTDTGTSAAREYWESGQAAIQAAGQKPADVKIPVGFTTFPGEIWQTPRSWAETSYRTLTYFNKAKRGGHFAAWEEPMLFTEEVRAAFKTLR